MKWSGSVAAGAGYCSSGGRVFPEPWVQGSLNLWPEGLGVQHLAGPRPAGWDHVWSPVLISGHITEIRGLPVEPVPIAAGSFNGWTEVAAQVWLRERFDLADGDVVTLELDATESPVAVLVPRRSDGGWRDRVWEFTRPRWEALGWPIIEGHHDDGPFNRSAAVNAAADADWSVAVIIDADVVVDVWQVQAAVDCARTGVPAIAYTRRTHMGRRTTERVLAGWPGDWSTGREFVMGLEAVSSANVIARATWDAIGGFDESFVGWGWEDNAFIAATETMSGRNTERIPGMCWHFWHPRKTERTNRRDPLQAANESRFRRYEAAYGDEGAMRALLR